MKKIRCAVTLLLTLCLLCSGSFFASHSQFILLNCCDISQFFCLYVCSTSHVREFTGCLHATYIISCFVQAQFSPRAQIALLLSSGGLDLIQSTTNEFTASCNYLLVYDLSDKWMYRQTVLMSSSLKSSRAFYVHTSDILSACEEIHFFNQPRLLKIIFLCC